MEDLEKDMKKYFQHRQIQPSENAWDKMELLLKEEQSVKKKPKTIYYMLSAAASILLFVGLWNVFENKDQVQFPETKPAEQFVVNELQNVAPIIKEEEKSVSANVKESIVVDKISNKSHIKNDNVLAEIVQNNKNQPKEEEVGERIEDQHIIQKSHSEIEEKLLAQESKIEIKVNPIKLLRSAEMERQTDNMVSNGQNFWKKVKDINTIVVHSN